MHYSQHLYSAELSPYFIDSHLPPLHDARARAGVLVNAWDLEIRLTNRFLVTIYIVTN